MNKFLANFGNELFDKEKKRKQSQFVIEETTVENYSWLRKKYV